MLKKNILCWLLFVVLLSTIPVFAVDNSRIERTTVNGMSILLQKTNSELVEMVLLLKSGSGIEPATQKGIAAIMNNIVYWIFSDPKTKIGNFAISTNPDYTLVTLTVLSRDIKPALEKIKFILTAPIYDYDSVLDLKKFYNTQYKAFTALTKSYADFNREFYGENHPYNNWAEEKSFLTISGVDVYKWYRQTYQPGNALLSISGGYRGNIADLEKFFTHMKSEQVDRRLLIQPVNITKDIEIEREDPNGRATSVVIGFPAPRIQDPEYPAFRVISFYLEEYQHYFDELRVKEGLIYTDMVYYNYLEKPKAPNIAFATMTDPESLKKVETKTIEITNRLMKQGIEKVEIERVVKAMKAGIDAQKTANKGLALKNALSQYLQTQLIYDENLIPKLEQINTDDIIKAAAKYFGHHIKVAYIPKTLADNL